MAQLKQKPIVMLGGYFDESGIAGTEDATAIAGFIGRPDALARLAKRWDAVLSVYGVDCFHSFVFYAPAEKVRRSSTNPYSGWSKTKRKRFVDELFKTLENCGVQLKAVGADAKAFRKRTLEERRWLTGGVPSPTSTTGRWKFQGKPSSPYHMVFRGLIENCCNSLPANAKLHIVMSRQDQMQASALLLYDAMRLAFSECGEHLADAITFASHRAYPQLQAADLIAFHLRQVVSNRRVAPARAPWGVHKRITNLARTAKDAELMDDGVIEILCQSLAARYEQNQRDRDKAAQERKEEKRRRLA